MRIDRFISRQLEVNRRDVKRMLAEKRIMIDGETACDAEYVISAFSHITCDGRVLQNNTPKYIMLNKSVGVVSATKDTQHPTVVDLLDPTSSSDLHIVGRLDLNSSGLLLLTNDSRWSRRLMEPSHKVPKVYRVTLENPLTPEYISAFAEGMYFGYEDITTQPAMLKIMSEYVAEVSLIEGRYHQIKRMFGRFRNPVLALHRVSIGSLSLDPDLKSGESRFLRADEVLELSL